MNACLANSMKITLPVLALGLLGFAAAPALMPQQAKAAAKAKPDAAPPAAATSAAGDLKAGSYDIDPLHSTVIFRILHMKVSPFYGRFDKVSGNFTIDPAKPEAATLDVKIQADSLDTNNDKRNQDVMGPDLLSVKEFPVMEFKSDKVKKAGAGYEVTGKFTLHGVTKDLTLQIDQTGASEGKHGTAAGFETTFTIKRSDFGMTSMADALGDDIKVMVGIEGHGG